MVIRIETSPDSGEVLTPSYKGIERTEEALLFDVENIVNAPYSAENYQLLKDALENKSVKIVTKDDEFTGCITSADGSNGLLEVGFAGGRFLSAKMTDIVSIKEVSSGEAFEASEENVFDTDKSRDVLRERMQRVFNAQEAN